MKNVEKEQVLTSQKLAEKQIQCLIDNTNMDDNDDRKRTKNFCDWTSKKIELVINEKNFNENDSAYNNIKRGSVVWIEFGFNIGAEFGGKHPAIVLRKTSSSVLYFLCHLKSRRR
ncbi:MAG: hypothetical protein IJ365_09020 [Clostridia bacterium]|nr:hypothetical protein [Clostridia bacterium]